MTISKKTAIIFSSLLILMTLLVIALLLRFMVFGKTEISTDPQTLDTRISVIMTEEEKVYVLKEMRGMLEGVQEIVSSIRTKDMEKISIVARSLGRNVADDAPAGLMGKLPLDFKTLGLSTHASFDQIAVTARDAEKMDLVLLQLGNVMGNCVACHATFQIKTDKDQAMKRLGADEQEGSLAFLKFLIEPANSWQWQENNTKALVQHLADKPISIGYP